MKYLNLPTLLFFLATVNFVIAQYAGSRHDAACEYLAYRIYCFGGSSTVAKSITTTSTSMAMLDILKHSGEPIDVLNTKWEYIVTNNGELVQPRGGPQHMRLEDKNTMVISGGFSSTTTKLTHQTISFNANGSTWSTLPNYEDSGANRQIYVASTVYIHGLGIGFYGGKEDIYDKGWTYPGINMSAYTDEKNDRRTIGYAKLTFLNPITTSNNMWSQYSSEKNSMRFFTSYQTSVYDKINNRILFLGGEYQNPARTYHYQTFSSAPSFNLNDGSWSMQNLTGSNIPTYRVLHTATIFGSDKRSVLLYGGQNSADDNLWAVSDYCYTLDLVLNRWTLQNIIPSSTEVLIRTRHSALLVDDDTVFIIYGITEKGLSANSTLILNVKDPSAVLAVSSYIHPQAESETLLPAPTSTDNAGPTSSSKPVSDSPGGDQASVSDVVSENGVKPITQSDMQKTIGIAVGCTAGGLVIIGSLVFFFCRRRRSKKHQRELEELEEKRREIETLQKMAHVEEEPMMVNWDEIDKELGRSSAQPGGSQYTYSPQFSEQTTTIISGSAADHSSPTFPKQEIKNQRLDNINQYNHNVSTERQASMDQYNNAAPLGRPDVIEEDCHAVQYVPHIQKPDGV
ncbi:uncharacterized protein EV154DRAFT_494595 [Mucor mucedo]|uniref:uncharacterized protein n=1 Tax=Mucor mucedo TaxID=29922 RepID=UPI002220DBBA|nr:uncharacterized protein EV154DRAFT_494595 [Mucor mucedo]KAI7895689.1 hypothetical protein EV154DRAFT_494595 [Mucor mucedo]